IFGDIFGDILGGQRSRGGRRSRMQVGGDLQLKVNVSFDEAAFGISRVVSLSRHIECPTCNGTACAPGTSPSSCGHCHGQGEVRRQQGFFTMATVCPSCQGQGKVITTPCPKCRGNARISRTVDLEVKIPAGIDHGQRLKLSGEGDSGLNGGPRGDLYVLVSVKEHEFFEREDFDIYCTVPVSFSQAALGTEMEVPTLKGRVKVTVPAGTQSGKRMRLKAKGIPRLGGHGHGDQIISIHVETPTKLCGEQQELFQRLAMLEKQECNPMSRKFFDKVKNLFQ
ncbi:MAG: molecular chaperone DnaJ, partial [Bdellovibrionales bacterium]|nr:molecular chaperone DnaJ [Bdellovibrionales bacterium]